jgi:hypothetical protein
LTAHFRPRAADWATSSRAGITSVRASPERPGARNGRRYPRSTKWQGPRFSLSRACRCLPACPRRQPLACRMGAGDIHSRKPARRTTFPLFLPTHSPYLLRCLSFTTPLSFTRPAFVALFVSLFSQIFPWKITTLKKKHKVGLISCLSLSLCKHPFLLHRRQPPHSFSEPTTSTKALSQLCSAKEQSPASHFPDQPILSIAVGRSK